MSGEAKSRPSAEPALQVDTREELVYLLGQACEIEHGLMCEYLYAQFSLKRGLDEGLTEGQLARVQAWEKTLISVIKQEMLHLALATNILTAIGAAPHFERPNFPILSRWYPAGVQIALVPFGEQARCATSSTSNGPRARRAGTHLCRPQQAGWPGRARPPGRQAAVDEPGHRGIRPQDNRLTAATGSRRPPRTVRLACLPRSSPGSVSLAQDR